MLQQVCGVWLYWQQVTYSFFCFLALIAPDDYEHIYAQSSEKKCNAKKKPEQEIPDDAPTVLKEIVQKERSAKQRSPIGQDDANGPDVKDDPEASGCCCSII